MSVSLVTVAASPSRESAKRMHRPLRWLVLLALLLSGAQNLAAQEIPDQTSTTLHNVVGEFPPYTGAKLHKQGLLSAILAEALHHSGIQLQSQGLPWSEIPDALMNRKADVSVGWVRNREREAQFLYSDPLIYGATVFFHHADLTFSWNRLEELAYYRIGVTQGYSYTDRFDDLLRNNTLTATPHASDQDNLESLIEGTTDLFPVDRLVGEFLLESHFPQRGVRIRHDEKPLAEPSLHLIVDAGHPRAEEIIKSVNYGLVQMQNVGTYNHLIKSTLLALYIQRMKILTEEYAPYNHLNESGQVAGLSINILQQIMQHLGVERKVSPDDVYPWARAYHLVQRVPNAAILAISKTPEREPLFQWVGPIVRSRVVLTAAKRLKLAGRAPDQLGNARICVIHEDIAAQVLQRWSIPEDRLFTTNHPNTCANMLAKGRVEAWAYGEIASRWYMKAIGADLDSFESISTLEETAQYIAFNRQVPTSVVGRFQEVLELMAFRGELRKLKAEFLPPQ